MRTRFPPSPTGYLHVGALRTALYSYLVAKKDNGTFYLRIEDTDRERHVEDATKHFIEMLTWAGIPPDEGVMLHGETIVERGEYGPYIQSKRLPIYQEHVHQLVEKGHAYRCFCTKERLEEMRKMQEERHLPPMYDRTCLSIAKEESLARSAKEPHVIRMLIPRGEKIEFKDLIRGKVEFATNTIDDQVLLKSDGFPTYHLAHVVDDHLMKTDVVIRGEEWLPSLPKHLLLFRMFGWQAPKYAHVPLLLNPGGGKLSKRQGDVSLESYIEKGYLKEAIINFIAMLGWNPGTEQEIFSLPELIKAFSIERIQKSGAMFDTGKLDWLQGQWIRKIALPEFVERIRPIIGAKFKEAMSDERLAEKAKLIQERITFFTEAPDMMSYFYEEPTVSIDLLASEKQKVTKEDLPKIFELLTNALSTIPENKWSRESIMNALEPAMSSAGFKKGQVLWPLRAALTGREYSPGAYEVAAILGKVQTNERLQRASMAIEN